MNGKWPTVVLMASIITIFTTVFLYILDNMEDRLQRCEQRMIQGERGTDAEHEKGHE